MNNYLWGQPWAFLLLFAWLYLLYFLFFKKDKKQAYLKMSTIKNFKSWKNKGRVLFLNLNSALILLSFLLLILALARPQRADSQVKRTLEGLDIVLVMDISDSMLIEDMKPLNRLEAAKETIANFIKQRRSDRIGVVIFAGEAFTLVPPTLDYQLVLDRVSQIETAQMAHIKDGTAIGVGMASGAARLKDSQAKSRVMIFMTDGENNSGTIDPETGLEIAKGYGLKIYTIGIGRSGPTKLPIYTPDRFGNRHKSYQPFESTVNDELLTKMAQDTGGKYFRATKEDSLAGVFNEINKLETTKIEDNKYTRYEEFFPYFLAAGLAMFLVSRFLSMTVLRVVP